MTAQAVTPSLNQPLAELDPDIAEVLPGELARQRETLEMIASENFVPRAVLECQGSVLTNKYAEGYPGRRYYGGCEVVDVAESLAIERAKEEIAPTRPVPGVEHAYWCRLGAKEFVRWVRGEDEDEFFNAFARIYAARESDLEEGARFVGAFRANGLAIPVWELVPGTEAEELTKPLQAMGKHLEAALADTSPLSPEVRRAKAGIISRQVNL